MKDGLLDIISVDPDFYPDWTKLKPSLNDPMDRVIWRSKQNLDYAFLMMYAQDRGKYYLQLEDDFIGKPDFVSTILSEAQSNEEVHCQSVSKWIMNSVFYHALKREKPWVMIDFCKIFGYIGKLFHNNDLADLIQFYMMFYPDKPVDWLLAHYFITKICPPHQNEKDCIKSIVRDSFLETLRIYHFCHTTFRNPLL